VKVCGVELRHAKRLRHADAAGPTRARQRPENLNFPPFFEQFEFEFPAFSGCALAFLLVDLCCLCVLFNYRIGSFLAFFAIATPGAWMLAEQGSYPIRKFCGFEEYSLACSARWCHERRRIFWLRLNDSEGLSVQPVWEYVLHGRVEDCFFTLHILPYIVSVQNI